MIGRPLSRGKRIALGTLSMIVLIAVYSLLSVRQHARNPLDSSIPGLNQIARGIQKIVSMNEVSGERWILADSWATFSRLFLGLVVGIAGAVFFGLITGAFSSAEAFFSPPLVILGKIPYTAALAVFFVIFGIETRMFVAIVAASMLPTLAQAIHLAVRDVPQENLYKAATLGASTSEQIWEVVFKQIIPKILDAIRLNLGTTMIVLIAAELLVADVGFGYTIRIQWRRAEMSVVFTYLAILAGFGFLMDAALRAVIRTICPWYGAMERDDRGTA